MANDEQTGAETQGEASREAVAETRGAIGATATLTRTLSEADLALFALVMGDVDVTAQAPLLPLAASAALA